MKLRYYLRGLGIGIIVTALLMGFSEKTKVPLTDAEIKAKALTLGMVEGDSLKLSDLENPENTVSPTPVVIPTPETTPETTGTPVPEETPETTGTPVPEETLETTGTPVPEETPETTGTPVPEETPETTGTPVPEETPETTPGVSDQNLTEILLVIKAGSGSEKVCRQLEEAGLIEDASAYDRYLIENGYSTRIRVGSYRIPVGSTYEEIAKIITGKS